MDKMATTRNTKRNIQIVEFSEPIKANIDKTLFEFWFDIKYKEIYRKYYRYKNKPECFVMIEYENNPKSFVALEYEEKYVTKEVIVSLSKKAMEEVSKLLKLVALEN